MKISVVTELSAEEIEHWVGVSIALGFLREEPRKAWTDRERKQAIRFAIRRFLKESACEKRK